MVFSPAASAVAFGMVFSLLTSTSAAAAVAFGGLDIVACVSGLRGAGDYDGSHCTVMGTTEFATNYTSVDRAGDPLWTTEFRFAHASSLLAFENAPFRYVPKYGGFDAAQIAKGGAGDEAVDLISGWAVIDENIYVFANVSSASSFSPELADKVWQRWFGSHGTTPPYAIAAGPFNTDCFNQVPDGSLAPTGGNCHSKPLRRTDLSASSFLRGIDVSHYQGTVDWSKVASSGITFGCAKATEGLTYVDNTFKKNWAGMRAAGLTRCAYHFARPASSPVDQAKHFVETVNQAGGYRSSKTLQLMLDLEATDGKSAADVWEWTQAFISEVKALTGRPGIIYTGYYFWRDSVGNPSDNLDSPLWLAAYTKKAPSVPAAWSSWTFWQYDDNGARSPGGPAGTVPGIAGHSVDVDYFRYDEATLARFCFP